MSKWEAYQQDGVEGGISLEDLTALSSRIEKIIDNGNLTEQQMITALNTVFKDKELPPLQNEDDLGYFMDTFEELTYGVGPK
jgi:hypothetical protein